MAPYMALHRNQMPEETSKRRIQPLENPLNYGELADYASFFELLAGLKTRIRKAKARRLAARRRAKNSQTSEMKSIVQN